MSAIRTRQPGEPLPAGHVCRCYDCAADRLPPKDIELSVDDAAHGWWTAGGLPRVERILLDGVYHGTVAQCQWRGRELWALLLNLPLHRCETCQRTGVVGKGNACVSLVFPKRIDLEVAPSFAQTWGDILARVAQRDDNPSIQPRWESHALGPRVIARTDDPDLSTSRRFTSHCWELHVAHAWGDEEAARAKIEMQVLHELSQSWAWFRMSMPSVTYEWSS